MKYIKVCEGSRSSKNLSRLTDTFRLNRPAIYTYYPIENCKHTIQIMRIMPFKDIYSYGSSLDPRESRHNYWFVLIESYLVTSSNDYTEERYKYYYIDEPIEIISEVMGMTVEDLSKALLEHEIEEN